MASIRRVFYLLAGTLLMLCSLGVAFLGKQHVGGRILASIILAGLGMLAVLFGLSRFKVQQGCPDEDDPAPRLGGER